MRNKRQLAIRNNNDLYREIFESRDTISVLSPTIWYSLEKTPPLYTNLVTVSEKWKPDDIFTEIDRKYEEEKWEEWSVKDSFSSMDLTEYGFAKLFEAQWIYLKKLKFMPKVSDENLSYRIIENESDLAKWRITWDSNETLGERIFSPKLLNNPRVFFIAGDDGKKNVSGCLVNQTENVLGISNFFSPEDDINYWSEMIRFIFDSIAHADIVGYGQKEIVAKLQLLGFEPTGDLTVWLKKRDFQSS